MSFSRCFIEFSSTPLAFSSIIILILCRYTLSTTSPTSVRPPLLPSIITLLNIFHRCSKHFTLSFPLGSLSASLCIKRFILRIIITCLSKRNLLLRWLFSIIIIIVRKTTTTSIGFIIFNLSLFFNIKLLSFLNEDFYTYFLMLL